MLRRKLVVGSNDTGTAPEAPEQDRRRSERLRTVFRVAKVMRERATGLWRVRNISDFGMMMLTGARPEQGETLSIALSESISVEAKVVWCRDDSCGVEFVEPVDSGELLKALADDPAYRAPRLPVDIAAAAWCERGVHSIRVANMSQHGIGFTHDGWVRAGMKLLIRFENGLQRHGMVRWADTLQGGLRLLDPFTCSELESVGASKAA